MREKDDGIELLKRSVRFYPNTKFWLVSNGLTEEIILQAKGLGAERAISKSVLLQVLKETGIITLKKKFMKPRHHHVPVDGRP